MGEHGDSWDWFRGNAPAGQAWFSEEYRWGFFLRVLEGLAHMHSNGVVHCDMKPENVMVGSDLNPLIADLGSAVDLGKEKCKGGTDGYKSDTHRSHPSSPKTDLYAAGEVLLFLFPEHRGDVSPTVIEQFASWMKQGHYESAEEVINAMSSAKKNQGLVFPKPTEVFEKLKAQCDGHDTSIAERVGCDCYNLEEKIRYLQNALALLVEAEGGNGDGGSEKADLDQAVLDISI